MGDIFTAIKEGIQDVFPEVEDMEITADTVLEEIPDWDSMAAVNLQTFLDETFHISVPLDLLSEETPISELVSFIENPDKMSVAA
ncbi:acyl carrier protein [Desulfococcaceae bacterium HSG8]|nr:acyl carrier protein [Desulfococcaceae bacterium HSG8]